MNIVDFFIGGLLVNAMPHLIFGLTKTHFLGLFGYSPKGNIAYALLQFILCGVLIVIKYGFTSWLDNGFLVGGIAVLFLYFVLGKFMVNLYGEKEEQIKE